MLVHRMWTRRAEPSGPLWNSVKSWAKKRASVSYVVAQACHASHWELKQGNCEFQGSLSYVTTGHIDQKTTGRRQLGGVTPASDSFMFWCHLSQSSWKSPLYPCERMNQKEIPSSYYDGNSLFLMIDPCTDLRGSLDPSICCKNHIRLTLPYCII